MPRPKTLKQTLPSLGRILKKFAPHLRQQGWLISGSFLALLVETGFRLLEPWPMKFIFDRILLTGFDVGDVEFFGLERFGATGLLTLLALVMVLVSTGRGFCAYLSTVGMAVTATRVMTEIRSQLYSHIQRLSLAFHCHAKSGDLMTRVTYDIERLREVTVVAALPLITNVLSMVGMLGVMFWVNVELALIAIAILPLFLLTTASMSRRISGVARQQRKREGAMAATAAEAIGAIKVVQALSLQRMLETAFASQNKKSLKEGAKAQKLRAGQERTVEVLVAVATALVLWRGVQLVQLGSVTPGDLLVFISYLKVAFKPMRQLAKYTGQIAKAVASGERILDLFDIVPEIRDSRGAMDAPPFAGRVEFRRVSFGYESDQRVLDGLNFTVKPGERIALVGASGGGKSTLVSLLLRLYDPWEGQIRIDGHDLREYKIESLRRQISIVLQDSVLFAASVRDNIAYGCLGATDWEIEAAAKLANAHDFILELPEGYDTVLGERGATLSGGQRQRIAIARAAVRQAPIVILDEPTVGLDNRSEAVVNEALERLTRDRTTFLITHDLDAARSADRIFYLEGGKVCESGTHEELLDRGERYANLYAPKSLLAKC